MKAKPSYPDINQLTKLLVTFLKPELSKLLASHDFFSFLPTELKEIPSKIIGLFGDIKVLKKHVRDMKIELLGDLNEIPTKLETFTSTISIQEKLKILDSLPSLLHKVTNTLNRFATMVENASGATTMNVSSAGKATASPVEGEKNTKDADTNLKDELILKRKKSPKITNCEVLTKKGPITLKIYREDGSDEVISNLKVDDLHLAEWREVIQACLDKSEKGWKTIYDLVKTRLDQLTQTEQELKIDLNKPLKEQDPPNELNELANKKKNRTSDLKDHYRSTKKHKSSSSA
ncbi:hypothetical protein Tco_1578636 [Tanacetum coccineum]